MRINRFILSFSLIILVTFSMLSCKKEEEPILEKYTYNFFGTFDTVVSTVIYANNPEEAQTYNEYIESRFNELHRDYDRYHSYEGLNNLRTINEMAGIEAVEVDDDLFNLLDLSIKRYYEFGHETDISFGRVIDVWQKYQDINSNLLGNESSDDLLPSREELEEANKYTGIDKIELDYDKKTVYVKDSGTLVDVGSTAKGYAVEIVMDELEEMGCKSALISAGGNVKAIGKPLDGIRDKWGVGIRNPQSMLLENTEERLIETLFISGVSVVTSGDYERFFLVDGERYHHVIDTSTLYPTKHFSSLTIVHKDSGLADFLSTTLFMMTVEEGMDLINQIEGAEAYWVNYDGSVQYTKGMEKMMLSKGASGAK